MNYKDVIFGSAKLDAGKSATVGMQVGQGAAQLHSFNTASLRNDLALLWVVNQAPTAVAGAAIAVERNSPVTLDGGASQDPENALVGFGWSQVSGAAVDLVDADQAVCRFTSPDSVEDLVFELRVEDAEGVPAFDTITVTVANTGPTLIQLELPSSAATGEAVLLQATWQDPTPQERYTVVVDWGDQSPPETWDQADAALPPRTHSYAQAGDYTVELWVTDGAGDLISERASIAVVGDPQAVQPPAGGQDGAPAYSSRWRKCGGCVLSPAPGEYPGPAVALLALLLLGSLVLRRRCPGPVVPGSPRWQVGS